MKKTINLLSIIIIALLITACGSNKTLASVNNQISDLNKQLDAANAKLSENEKLIGQLKDENIVYSKEAQDCRIAKENASRKLEKLEADLAFKGMSPQLLATPAR